MKESSRRTLNGTDLGTLSNCFAGVVCAAAGLLLASGSPAQNLFVSQVNGGPNGTITKVTPGDVKSSFATGVLSLGMAFQPAPVPPPPTVTCPPATVVECGVPTQMTAEVSADVLHMPEGLTSLETLPVGNPGNAGQWRGRGPGRVCGAVAYTYRIGKFEVTAAQYVQFLNAVARSDTYGLYDTMMAYHDGGCGIQRSGTPANFVYSVARDWANRPVTIVSWGDAARFVNWLENGQPTGPQGPSTTEDGSYLLNGATDNNGLLAVTRKPGARWVLPSEDEWFKAGYHKNDGPTGHYWQYPTGSDIAPRNVLANPDPGNSANYYDVSGAGTGGYTLGYPYYRTEVGAFANSPSPYGTFDQGGNVWEWNDSPPEGSVRGCQGGSWSDFNGGSMHAAYRYFQFPGSSLSDTGFRVVLVVPAPTVICPPPTNVQCGASMQLTAQVSVGAAAAVVWFLNGAPIQTNFVSAGSSDVPIFGDWLAVGTNILTVAVADGTNAALCSTTVTVVDTTPPVISDVVAFPNVLWPPCHKMATVNVSASVSDECGEASWKIVGVRNSESVNGRSYGNTSQDFKIIGEHTVELRAERSGNSDARIYYVTVQATDAAGNQSRMQTVTVTVPKSQGEAKP